MVRAAQAAPSWKNSQTARFYVSLSDEMREKTRDALASFNKERTENVGAFIVTTVVHGISGYMANGATHLGNGFECFDNGLIVERDIKATPVAKKIAELEGIDLSEVKGSGVNGKIMKADVLRHRKNTNDIPEDTIIPITGMRKAIFENMANSLAILSMHLQAQMKDRK